MEIEQILLILKHNMPKQDTSFAEKIGFWLAKIQTTIDILTEIVFEKLENTSETSTNLAQKQEGKIKKFIKASWGFIGKIGKSYYEKYAELKQEK